MGATELSSFIQAMNFTRDSLVFLDEVTTVLPIKDAYAFFGSLKEFLASEGHTLLVVDHRLELGGTIFLDTITVQ
jgi:ABC-type uncharacterized transport system ATPase subunit